MIFCLPYWYRAYTLPGSLKRLTVFYGCAGLPAENILSSSTFFLMSFYYRTELRKKSSLIRKTSLFLREKRPCSLHSRLIFYLLFGPDGTVEGFRLGDLVIRDLIQRIGDGFKGLRAGALQRSRIQRILSEAFCEIL